ncbi:MAG: enoyl-CoA hydratase/isomerase family protein [Burkholderiaceae bacterium]
MTDARTMDKSGTDGAGEPAVLREQTGRVLTLTMNRPKACNAMNKPMYRGIIEAMEEAQRDPGVGCVVLTGRGKYFAAGKDMKELNAERQTPLEAIEQRLSSPETASYFYNYLSSYRLPLITAINGPAIGGGAITAFLGDISIAASDVYFSLPELDRGVTAVGATLVFPKLVSRAKGMPLVLTARKFSADEADRIGLISMVVEPGKVMEVAQQMAEDISLKSTTAIRFFKMALQAGPWADNPAADIAREALRSLAETPERFEATERIVEQIDSSRRPRAST